MVEGLEGGLHGGSSPSNQRLTVPEAAAALGITEAAVRGRIKRGTLDSYRESGTVYVLIGVDEPTAKPNAPSDVPTDQSELVAVLREQLAAEREANREMRRLLAAALERIPEIEAPSEVSESPESAGEDDVVVSDTPEPRSTTEGPPEPSPEGRSWWRRMFGG